MYLKFVLDDEDPVITGTPADITQITDDGVATAVVTWKPPTASDNSGHVTLTSSHNPGDTFPLDVTTVTYTAIDSDSNLMTESFTVTIEGKHEVMVLIETKAYKY